MSLKKPFYKLLVLFFCMLYFSCHGRFIPHSIDFGSLQKTNNENPFDSEIHFPLEIKHEIKVSSAPKQRLQRVGHILFVPTKDGRVEVYDLQSAKRIGRMKIPGGVHANILPIDENLLISLEFGKKSLFAFDPSKDKKVWVAELGSIKTIPVILDEWIIVGSLYKGVFCLNRSNGEIKWKTNLKSQLHADPLNVGRVLIQGTESGKLVALSIDSGKIQWQKDFKSPFLSSPILADGNIVVCNTNGTVAKLSIDGEFIWERKFGLEFRRTPSFSNQTLITAGQDGIIRALDLENGSLLWQYKTGAIIGNKPLVTSQYVIFGTLDKRLIFLSLDSGEEKWQVELFGRVRTDPLLYENGFIIGSENNYIYVFQSRKISD